MDTIHAMEMVVELDLDIEAEKMEILHFLDAINVIMTFVRSVRLYIRKRIKTKTIMKMKNWSSMSLRVGNALIAWQTSVNIVKSTLQMGR